MTGGGTLESVAFPALVGDIGGTNARFALLESADAPVERLPNVQTADFPTIEDAIAAAVLTRTVLRPKTAMLALAAPIAGERVNLTNSHWAVAPRAMIARFGLQEVVLLNDFEAQSLALPGLRDSDCDMIGGGSARPDGTRVVVGPGTGLGAGALIHGRDRWIPVPGEGGHIDLAPMTGRDFAVWPHIERASGRVSGEMLLSGSGLVRLYRGVCAADGAAAPLASPSDIAGAGLAETSPQAAETLTLFATYLGRLAGNLALVFIPRGGVYLAGGISTKIAPALKSGAFREAFLNKAPHRAMLETIATAIVTKSDAALAGIAAFARLPERFEVDLAGRRWRG